MTPALRIAALSAVLLGLGAALWLHAATALLPPAAWPPPPFDPDAMDLPALRLAFGLAPRGVVALVVGAALGLAGAILQAVLRNPVADPTVLGVSAGAQLALVSATLFAPALLAAAGRGPVALAGAAVAAAIVLGIGARRGFAPVTVAVAGMLAGLFAAAVATAMTLAQGHYLLSLVIWNGGSLVQSDWSGARNLALVLAAGALAASLLARPLRVLSIGAEGARSLGLGVGAVRFAAVAVAVCLSAAVSAEVGLVAFAGLAAPAFARTLGARGPAQLMLASVPLGAGFLSLCDGLTLAIGARFGEMFPTGALTGLVGGPLLLWLLPRLRGSTPPGAEAGEPAPRRARPGPALAAIAALLAVGVLAALAIGRLPGGWAVLDASSVAQFLPLRLPRLVAAVAAGGLLATAGALLQRLTGNPLASPEVLGVSGGAALGYAATVFALPAAGGAALALGSAAGGALALVLLAGYVLGRDMPPERVLLAGIAVSALATAVLSAIMATGDARAWKILAWLAGSSSAVGPAGAAALAALSLAGLAAALAMRRWLAILTLGASVADALGLPRLRARLLPVVVAGIATGAATVLVGPMSFVGLMAPHLARRLGFARPEAQLAAAWLIGATLMLVADFGARVATFPYEQPLGLFATLIGAPWLAWLMMRRHA